MDYIMTALLFYLFGVGVYTIERWVAIKLLKKKDFKTYKGVLINGKKRAKYIVAAIVILIKFWVSINIFHVKADAKVILFTTLEYFAVVLGIITGAWAAPRIRRLINRSGSYINEVDAGKRNPFKDVKDVIVDGAKGSLKITTEKKEEQVITVEEQAQETEPITPTTPVTPVIPVPEEKKDSQSAGKKLNDSVDNFLKKKY